jgi:hypothetical protein
MKQSIKKLHEAVKAAKLGTANVSINYRDRRITVHVIISNNEHDPIYHEVKYTETDSDYSQLEDILEKEVNKAITFINSIHD